MNGEPIVSDLVLDDRGDEGFIWLVGFSISDGHTRRRLLFWILTRVIDFVLGEAVTKASLIRRLR